MFRLGWLQPPSSSSPRPRPLLIKLCTVWDRKLILLRKTNLRDFHIKRLFLREDVAPDHKFRQKRSAPSQSNANHSPPTSVAVESSSANASVSIPAELTGEVEELAKKLDTKQTKQTSYQPLQFRRHGRGGFGVGYSYEYEEETNLV